MRLTEYSGAEADILFALNKGDCLCYECTINGCDTKIIGCPEGEDPCWCEKNGYLSKYDCSSNPICTSEVSQGCDCDRCEGFIGGKYFGRWILRGTFFGQNGIWAGGLGPGGSVFEYGSGGWQGAFGFPEAREWLMRSENSALNSCSGGWSPSEGDPESGTIAANPPPDDGKWYYGMYIGGRVAWYSACSARPCVLNNFQGAGDGQLTIDSFSFTGSDCPENICCNGDSAQPTISPTGSCGHQNWVFGGPPGTPQAQCLGSCVFDGVCSNSASLFEPGYTKSQCEGLGGTWQSGVPCTPPG